MTTPPGNLGDYHTKHHSTSYDQHMCQHQFIGTSPGCAKILMAPPVSRQPLTFQHFQPQTDRTEPRLSSTAAPLVAATAVTTAISYYR
jgi:hypothetical protein